MLKNILNLMTPKSMKKVKIVKERRNNTMRLFVNEGESSNSDEVVNLPNFKYFMEICDKDNSIKKNHKFKTKLKREDFIWRNLEADNFRPVFLKKYKSKAKTPGTILSVSLAKKIIAENE
jgi:hypothetical protein